MRKAYATDKHRNPIAIITTVDRVMDQNGDYLNTILDRINQEMENLKQHVSDGKAAIASAITDMNQATASDASFATMATNIRNISKDTNTPTNFVLQNYGYYTDGQLKYGTLPNKSSTTLTQSHTAVVDDTGNAKIVLSTNLSEAYVNNTTVRIEIPYADLRNAIGLREEMIDSDYKVLGLQGTSSGVWQ